MLAIWGTVLPEEKHLQICLVITLLIALKTRNGYAIGFTFVFGIFFKLTAIFLAPAVLYLIWKEYEPRMIRRMAATGALVVIAMIYFFKFDWVDEALARFTANNNSAVPIHDSVWVLMSSATELRGVVTVSLVVGSFLVFRRHLPMFETLIGCGLVLGFAYTNLYMVSGSHDRQLMTWIPLLIFLFAQMPRNRWLVPLTAVLATLPYYQFRALQTASMLKFRLPLVRLSQSTLDSFKMGNWTSLFVIVAVLFCFVGFVNLERGLGSVESER